MDAVDRLRAVSRVMANLASSDAGATAASSVIGDLTGIVGVDLTPFRRRVVRPDDLVALDFTFENLRLVSTPKPRLVRRVASRPSTLIVRLQGQAIGEQDFQEVDPDNPENGPEAVPNLVQARLAGASRLAFTMPADAGGLDFSLDALLDACRRWPMALDTLARNDRPLFDFGIFVDGGLAGVATAVSALAAPSDLSVTLAPIAEGIATAMREAGMAGAAAALKAAGERVGAAAGAAVLRGDSGAEVVRALGTRSFDSAMRSAGRMDEAVARAARALFDAALGAEAGRMLSGRDAPLTVNVAGMLADFGDLVQLVLRPHLPAGNVTSLEAPYRLFLTPLAAAAWAHALRPVERTGRTELWHTRLAPRRDGLPDERTPTRKPLRAVWSHDYDPKKVGNSYTNPGTGLAKTSPTPRQRDEIVRLSAGYDEIDNGSPYDPRSIPADKVMLSTLGAALDLEGNWTRRPDFVNVSAWRHISNWARDHYIRVVEEGFLCPYGHRAALVSITERRFENAPAGGRGAYLRKRQFIIVRERVRRFPVTGQAFGGIDFPLTEVEIQTQVTPPIAKAPVDPTTPSSPDPEDEAFVPVVPGGDFAFQIRTVDIGGMPVTTAMPLVFVFSGANQFDASLPPNQQVIDTVLAKYNKATGVAVGRRMMPLGGAAIQYAPIDDPSQGADVKLPTNSVEVIAAKRSGAPNKYQPRFAPGFGEVDVEIPALKKLVGGGAVDAFQKAAYPTIYRNNGFGAGNPARLFLSLVDDLDLSFGAARSSENAGGFFEPNMAVQAMSALKGSVGDEANVGSGNFNPAAFFKGARLLGSILIEDLLTGVFDILGADAPEFVNVEIDGPDPHSEARILWNTDITTSIPLFKPGAGGQTTNFDLEVRTRVWLDGRPPETLVRSTLTNFKIDMFGLIILWFDRLQFLKEPGKKPDVNPDLHPQNAVVFGGPLEFVNKLSDLIPNGGFSDPPVLDISPTGIVAGYELDIPDVQIGVLSLTNMSLGARLRLPFDGDPISTRFNFAEREDPFNLTVSLFGGGGFFAIALDSGGVREVEAALEFGAAIAFDIGIASGGIYVKGGFYFHWLLEGSSGTIELTAYVEMGGELSVLGLITVSVKFYLALSYHKAGGMAELRGQASLIVEIEILFFSTSVTLTVERRFGGSEADPKFIDFIPDQATWTRYAAAFA